MNIKHLLPLLFALIVNTANAETELTIIKLKGRTADEVIPLIKPFIDQNDTVTGMGNQLIIRTSPERLTEIHKILEAFDHPPRRLIIHVYQGHLTEDKRQQLSGGINANLGKQVTIKAGDRTKENSVQLYARTNRTQRDHDVAQHIQTLEGETAFIATGKIIPVQQHNTYITNGHVYQQHTTQFQNATTGFYVTPRLNKNRVTLLISPHMNQLNKTDDTLEIQQASTTISGLLNEWIAVGGSNQNTQQQSTGLTHYQSTKIEDDSQIYLLVEEIE